MKIEARPVYIQDRLLVAVIFLLGALLAYSHAHYLASCLCTCGNGVQNSCYYILYNILRLVCGSL